MNTVDKDLTNALNTMEATTGNVLLPKRVNEGLRHFYENYSPVYANTPRRSHDTKFYEYRKVTDLPLASSVVEGEIADRSHAEYDTDVVQMKYVTTTGKITGPMIDASRGTGGIDAWKTEIQLHATALGRELERLYVAGDASTKATDFDGFSTLITQEEDADGDPLSLGILDAAIDVPLEEPSMIFMGRAHRRRLWALLQAQQRFNDRTEIAGGFRVPTYAGLPIIQVNREAEAALGNTVLMPDMNHAYGIVMREPTFELLGKTEDADGFFIRTYQALVVEGAEQFHVKITNVAAEVGGDVNP